MTPMELYKTFEQNIKTTEDSRVVVSKWCLPKDPYLPTIPLASAETERERAAYFAIAAERILWRKKILGIAVDAALADNPDILNSRPFGDNTPTLEELLAPKVAIAAALVPLTPPRGGGVDVKQVLAHPYLARLYCVKGLAGHHSPPFADGKDTSGISTHSWFLAGVNGLDNTTMIDGRSWLLAAHLLVRIVAKGDKPARENLARNFIVTGDVEEGQIIRVEMGRKLELAKRPAFRTLKWIMPTENANSAELENTMKNRIEKPATLEDAYELIESMRNRATRSFFMFLKESNLEGMKAEFANGADIYADDIETGDGALQIAKCEDVKIWLETHGANCGNMFYLLAKHDMLEVAEKMLAFYPVNAKDQNGLTAVDIAIINQEWDVARKLHRLGGRCDKWAKNNHYVRDVISKYYKEHHAGLCDTMPIKRALEFGLNPDTFFEHAIELRDIDMIEEALKAGRDPNKPLGNDSKIPILAIAQHCERNDDAIIDDIMELFYRYGVNRTSQLEREIEHHKARGFVHLAFGHQEPIKGKNPYFDKINSCLDNGTLKPDSSFYFVCGSDDFPILGSLFTLALDAGWVPVVEKCLECGASAKDYLLLEDDDCDNRRYLYAKYTPEEFVCHKERNYKSPETKQKLLDLLKKYMK